MALGYVDNIAMIAIGKDFNELTNRLENMMKKEGGGLQWSEEHNSRFKVTKSAILHLTRRTILDPDAEDRRIPPERPPLILEGKTV